MSKQPANKNAFVIHAFKNQPPKDPDLPRRCVLPTNARSGRRRRLLKSAQSTASRAVCCNGRGTLCRSWEKLQDAIQQIFNEDAGKLSFEELYRTGYNMVLHKHGDLLYNNVELALKERSCTLCERVEKSSDET
jgi:hypothetical protein